MSINVCKKYLGLVVLIPLFLTANVFAQNVNVSAEINANVVAIGSTAKLTLTVNGTQDVSSINLGTIDGFDVQYVGPSRRISIVNGQYSSSISFVYSLLATKVGKFEIPAFDIPVDNQTLKTTPIPIEVVDQQTTTANQAAQPQAVNLNDKIFLQLQTPKADLYLNEKVPIKILLFVSGINVSDLQYPQFDAVGFTVSNFDRPKQFQQMINGVRFDIVEFDATLYPTRVGELKVGPAKMECNLIIQNGDQNRGSLFDDDFFNTFFDRQEKRPITVTSKELTLQAQDLPQDGKPANFSGGVGNYTFDVTVSPTDVKVGDPITLKMLVQGEGNLNAVNFPRLKDETNFKVYDPTIKEEGGVKKLEQVIIPRNKDIKEVPAFDFAYFNTDLKKYLSITKGPFPIRVSEADAGKNAGVIVGLDKEEAKTVPVVKDALGEDIVFIKEKPGKIYTQGEYFYTQVWFYVLWALLSLSFIGAFVYYQMTYRLKNDDAYVRRTHAPKYAKAGLDLARRYLAEKRPKEFYDAVFKTLQNYLSHKFSLSLGDVNHERLRTLVGGAKKEEVLNDLKFIFDECDRIRYSSTSATESEMQGVLNKLEKVIDDCERSKS